MSSGVFALANTVTLELRPQMVRCIMFSEWVYHGVKCLVTWNLECHGGIMLYYIIEFIEKKHQIIFCSRFLEPLMLLIIILLRCKHIMTFRDIQVSHE